MGTLRVDIGDNPLSAEHRRLLRRLLRRGESPPERHPGESLVGDYHPKAIEIARENWRERMVHEHQSAAVFTQLVPQLIEAEAPLEVKTVITRSAMDELRHSGLCGQVVEYLGGEATAEADLTIEPLLDHPDCSPRERALRNVFFASCLSETVSMAQLTEERELDEDPCIDRVLKQLAGDESMPLGDIPAEIHEDARKLGFSESARARSLLYETLEEVILPNLDALGLDAQKAWNARKQEAAS